MAKTHAQTACERWIRDVWLPENYAATFAERAVSLTTGGIFKFDAVSDDQQILVTISTSQAAMSSGKKGVGKLMKLRADMLMHNLATAATKLMVFTEACMFESLRREQENGRAPHDIEFVLVELPSELSLPLAAARELASREVRARKDSTHGIDTVR